MSDTDPAVVFPHDFSDAESLGHSPRRPKRAPTPPVEWRKLIIDHNPFFLLSALCMLGGSVAVTNSLSWSPVRLERVLWLTATINVYELLLVGLAAVLIKRPTSRRDGSILLIIEVFFLVDVAFLNAELFAIDRWVGLVANVMLFTLALIKLAIIGRAIGLRLLGRELGVAASLLLLIYALPGVLKFYATARGGTLPALAMLGVWWAIFAVGIVLHGLFADRRSRATHWFAPLLWIVAGVSLLAHAGTSQWIYDQRFWGADLAPTLALLAYVLCSHRITRVAGVMFAGAAVMASGSFGPHLRATVFHQPLTPVHLTATAIYLVLAWTLARRLFAWFVGAGALALLAAIFGPSVATMRQMLGLILDRLENAVEYSRPKTSAHWGIVSITASFALLAIGALVSLRRESKERAT